MAVWEIVPENDPKQFPILLAQVYQKVESNCPPLKSGSVFMNC